MNDRSPERPPISEMIGENVARTLESQLVEDAQRLSRQAVSGQVASEREQRKGQREAEVAAIAGEVAQTVRADAVGTMETLRDNGINLPFLVLSLHLIAERHDAYWTQITTSERGEKGESSVGHSRVRVQAGVRKFHTGFLVTDTGDIRFFRANPGRDAAIDQEAIAKLAAFPIDASHMMHNLGSDNLHIASDREILEYGLDAKDAAKLSGDDDADEAIKLWRERMVQAATLFLADDRPDRRVAAHDRRLATEPRRHADSLPAERRTRMSWEQLQEYRHSRKRKKDPLKRYTDDWSNSERRNPNPNRRVENLSGTDRRIQERRDPNSYRYVPLPPALWTTEEVKVTEPTNIPSLA